MLQDVRDALLGEQIPLPKEQVSSLLGQLEPKRVEQLREWRTEVQMLKADLAQLEKSLQHRAFVTKVEDAGYRMQHFTRQVQRFRQEVQELEQEVEAHEKTLSGAIMNVEEGLLQLGKDVQVAGPE